MPQDSSAFGLPDGISFHTLAFSEVARCVVITVSLPGDRGRQLRMYTRGVDEVRYVEVPLPDKCNGFGVPVLSQKHPRLFAIGMWWEDDGGWHMGLHEVDLLDRTTKRVESVQKFFKGRTATPVRDHGPWIAQLLGCAADDHRLLATVATGTTTGDTTTYVYSVCLLDPSSGTFEKLTDLPRVFA